MDIPKYIKSNKYWLIILGLGLIFAFIYSYLALANNGPRFTWPDETANYFFIENYIAHNSFSVAEPLNQLAGNLLRPRSFNVYQGRLVPGSFLGLLLIYGLLGKICGFGLVLFITPLLAALAGPFFYQLLLKVFRTEIAFLSTILFYLHPVWWYYANFSMLPNIAFVAFLIIGFYFLLSLDQHNLKNNLLFSALAGFFIGLALLIRTNEFVWVLSVLTVLTLVYWRQLRWSYIVAFVLPLALVFLPVLYFNQTTYGNFLSFGYLRLEQGSGLASQLPSEFAGQHNHVLGLLKFIFIPFGLHPGNILTVAQSYILNLTWWLTLPAIWGVFVLIKRYKKQPKAVYLLSTVLVTSFLLVYYGSWIFEDQMTLRLNQLGISYVRYLLPVYILSLPFCSLFFLEIVGWLKNIRLKIVFFGFLLVSCLFFSLQLVYFSGNDNLPAIKNNIAGYNLINKKIIELTAPNAVIISQRSDKIFFPERRVISKWTALEYNYWINLLSDCVPLYYYAFEGPDYMAELNSGLNYYYGLTLGEEVRITAKESLYKIEFIKYGK